MSIAATPTCDQFSSLRSVAAILRSDLGISRQVYQGEPVYVVHDPVTFASHRLPLETYQLLTALGPNRQLGDIFHKLCSEGVFTTDEEEAFFGLITTLFRSGMIVLPFHDGEKLFATHQQMNQQVRRNRFMGFLFMQVPLTNPDAFLSRTFRRVGWLFSKPFFVLWALAALFAVLIVVSRTRDLAEPLNGLLATNNLLFLWLSFIGLKIWHEFGHGYACKVFGGRVPEMGTILIAGNPLAYVDASSAWSFPERWKRLIVMLGGMYFESLVAIPAIFIWAFSSNPLIQSCAFNVFVSATLVTVLFNLNPLMKFDGYFILSELLGIQNLKRRSEQHIHGLLKRHVLRLDVDQSVDGHRLSTLFVTYGISSALYRVVLVLSISAMIAQRFFMLGVCIATFYIGSSIWTTSRRLARYLLRHPETESIRTRCRILAGGLLIGIPAIIMLVPMPFGVVTEGIIGAETEYYVRVDTPGNFEAAHASTGIAVEAEHVLAELSNPIVEADVRVAQARLQEATLALNIAYGTSTVDAAKLKKQVSRLQQLLEKSQEAYDRLHISAPGPGQVVRNIDSRQSGSFLHRGSSVAIIVDGKPILRTWLSEEQLKSVLTDTDSHIAFRIPGRSMTTHQGRIISVEPAAQGTFTEAALTFIAGGQILVDPQTGEPMEPLFKVEILADESVVGLNDHGGRVSLRFDRAGESIGSWAVRRCWRFLYQLRVS